MEEMNNKKFGICNMAFAAGKESTEGAEIKRYIGVGSAFILGVNLNKSELEKVYNRDFDKEPEYISEDENGVKSVRLDFITRTDPEKNNGIDFITKYSLFLRNEYRYNRDKTKVQVKDKYGRFAWVGTEDAKNHVIPQYSNGPAHIDKDYTPAYVGEEDLIKFLIAYLNIPNVMRYINNEWVMVDNPEECKAGLDKIKDYFKGDFSEIKSVLKLQPKNKIKLAYGVKTSDDNKQYQSFFTEMPLKNGVSDYSRLDKAIKERKDAGAYASVEFSTEPLHEYVVEATSFEGNTASQTPFSSNDNLPW